MSKNTAPCEPASKPTVAIVTIAKDEHTYIREWIDAHTALGVSKFYIYDNGSSPPLVDILDNSSTTPAIHVIPFSGRNMQLLAYTHFITTVMPNAPEDWFAFIDCDEFMCPVKHASVPAFLEEYGHLGSIGLQWRMFGCNGHVTPPKTGGVIANYTTSETNRHIKTLAHRSRLTAPAVCIHNVSNTCRDLDGHLLNGPFYNGDMTDVIRINHYFTKSWSEFVTKAARGRAHDSTTRDLIDHIHDLCGFDAVPDTTLADTLGIEVHTPNTSPKDDANELETIRAVLNDHHALPNIHWAFRDNPRQALFAAKAAMTYHITEGSVANEQVAFLTEFVRSHRIANVLEIGFNGGLSASTFLGALASLRLVSVDIGHLPYVTQAADLIQRTFPGRHTLHIGDSTQVVPTLPRDELFDLAFVDGGHRDPVPRQDLENVLPLLRDGGWIIMDEYCPRVVWDDMVKAGRIHQVGVYTHGDRGWVVGYKANV